MHHHHGVGVGRKGLNVGREIVVADLHAVKLRRDFAARQLKLLDNVGNLFEAAVGGVGVLEVFRLVSPHLTGEDRAGGARWR